MRIQHNVPAQQKDDKSVSQYRYAFSKISYLMNTSKGNRKKLGYEGLRISCMAHLGPQQVKQENSGQWSTLTGIYIPLFPDIR